MELGAVSGSSRAVEFTQRARVARHVRWRNPVVHRSYAAERPFGSSLRSDGTREAPPGTPLPISVERTYWRSREDPQDTRIPRRHGDPRSRRRLCGSREGGRHHHRERCRRGDRHVRRGLRQHGRPGQGRPGRGRAQRHRAAARLGQLRRDDLDLRGEVRHQGQLRPAGRRVAGRDQRRQRPRRHRQGSRRLRPRPVGRPGQHRHVRALPGRDLGRHPRRVQGRRRRLGQRLRRLHVHRLRLGQGARRDLARRTCSSRSSRARSRSTATRPRPVPRSAA